MFKEKLATPGDHAFFFNGKAGKIEGIVTVPDTLRLNYAVILGHPHSLHGGTMHNKVITTLVRTFKDLGIPSLRFNFRGVGASEGAYDAGIGESEDMRHLVDQWLKEMPDALLIFAGFSFGSYVTYRAATLCKSALLISVAPAVHHYDYQEFTPRPHPWLIFQGDADEIVPPNLVWEFAESQSPPIPVIHFPDTSHFFHSKLLDLRAKITEHLIFL